MNRSLIKMTLRLIRTTAGRFFSLLAIVLIGVAFFVGVSSISMVMSDSVNEYSSRTHLKDITVYSDYGVDDEDIAAVNKIDNVVLAEGSQFVDVWASSEDALRITRIHSYRDNSEINNFVLRDGRMPENDREVLAEAGTNVLQGFPIGSKVTVSRPDNDLDTYLKHDEFTVVGTIDTPLYLNTTKENSTLSNQYISTYLYVPESAFSIDDYFIEMNVLIKDGASADKFSKAYLDYAGSVREEIETLATTQTKHRRGIIVDMAMEKYNEGLEEYNKGKQEFDEAIAEAEEKVKDGEAQLADGKAQLEQGRRKLNQSEADLVTAKADGEAQLVNAQAEIDSGYVQLEAGRAEYAAKEAEYSEKRAQLVDAQSQLNQPMDIGSTNLSTLVSELPGQYQSSANRMINFVGLDPNTATADDLEGAISSTISDIDAMESEIDRVRAEYPETHDGEEMTTYGQLREALGGSNSTFNRFEELSGTRFSDDTPISQFEATVSATRSALSSSSGAVSQASQSGGTDYVTISTAASAYPEINTLASQLGLSGSNTVGELKSAVNSAIAEIDNGLAQARNEITSAEARLETAKIQLEQGRNELATKLAEGRAQIDNGWAELRANEAKIAASEQEIEAGRQELEDKRKDGLSELNEAKAKLDKAKQDIDDLKEGSWMVLDRTKHYASETYKQTLEQMKAIATVFPVFFLSVAALVCMTTMTRLLSEERTQIGTLRALGYSGMQCAGIYLLYAGIASIVGSLIGCVAGLSSFPFVIYNSWTMMYILPKAVLHIPWGLVAGSIIIFLALMLGVTGWVIHSDLAEKPSQLMRPKAPRLGKQTLLASIPAIWDRLTFSWKVTVRNLVRYKQRMIMTIIGVAGCTALLITGFGISDSIQYMVDVQFGDIQVNDGSATLDTSNLSASEVSHVIQKIRSYAGVESVQEVCSYKVILEGNGTEATAEVEVFKNQEDIEKSWKLRERKSGNALTLPSDGVLISEKMAENLNLSIGDTITLESSIGLRRQVPIKGITEMYIYHYILLLEDFYKETFGTVSDTNLILINVTDDADLETLKRTISETDGVVGISFVDGVVANFRNMVKNIDYISYVLILSSMALAFVVLGNLTNVNIAERQREIATLKVLGFRPKEVQNYIFKENNILVIAGSLLGIPIGMILHRFIMAKIEMEYVMFGRSVDFISIVLSVALTMGFGILVNLLMRGKLTEIQMVESLKSVE